MNYFAVGASDLRSESERIVEALTEVVEAALDNGGAYCNQHSKIAGRDNFHKIERVEDVLVAPFP